MTWAHTFHYTNGTIFQVADGSGKTKKEIQDERRVCGEDIIVKEVCGTFKIRKKVLPPSIIYEDKKNDLLRWSLNRDLAW